MTSYKETKTVKFTLWASDIMTIFSLHMSHRTVFNFNRNTFIFLCAGDFPFNFCNFLEDTHCE